MSLRNVRSPDAPKMTTLHGCGIGRLDKPSRSGFEERMFGFKAGSYRAGTAREKTKDVHSATSAPRGCPCLLRAFASMMPSLRVGAGALTDRLLAARPRAR